MKANQVFLLAAAVALMPLLLFAQIDEKAMQSDITILEDVLNNLLSPTGSPKQVSSRGLYLDGYGVIFNVSYGRTDHFYFAKDLKIEMKLAKERQFKAQEDMARANEDKEKAKQQQEELKEKLEKSDQEPAWLNEELARQKSAGLAAEDFQKSVRNGKELAALYDAQGDSLSARKAGEIVADLKKNLALFYADYAQGLRKMPASERITVLVDFENAPVFRGLPEQDEKSEPADFYVSMAKSELPALRRSRNPESMLRFQDTKLNEAVDRELEIFTGILGKAAGEQAGQVPWGGSGTRSMYVPGYGVIILQRLSSFGFDNIKALKEYAEQAAIGDKTSAKAGIPLPEDNRKKKLAEVKEQIIDQLARYGGSLHSLKADENIMIVLSSKNGFWGDDRAQGISIAARMSDVRKVFNDEISLQVFKNTLAIQE